MHNGGPKRRSTQSNVGIVREAEALLWDSEEVSVQLAILVLVMNRDNAVVARRKILHYCCRFMRAGRNRRWPVVNGFAHVFGPTVRRPENCRTHHACRIAQSVDMNPKRTARWICRGKQGFGSQNV